MGPSRSTPSAAPVNQQTKKPAAAKKEEKVFHPQSRKAGQLERAQLRKHKLQQATSKRSAKAFNQLERTTFFFHALPPDVLALTLPELHDIIQDVWLHRHDEELEQERATRRKGRPRTAKEDRLTNLITSEAEEYRSGLEVPDLTDPPTVNLFRQWENEDPAFLHLLRFVRVSSALPDLVTVSRIGQRERENQELREKEEKGIRADAMDVV